MKVASQAITHHPLELALNPRLIQPVLSSFVKGNLQTDGLKSSGGGCHVLDAKYEPGKRCSVLYSMQERMIIGELTWPTSKPTTQTSAASLPQMQLYPFESDPGLPALKQAMDGEAMKRVLSSVLPECVEGAEKIVRCRVALLRYRLGKRCTLRYDLRLRNAIHGTVTKRTLYGKLYHSAAKAEAVYGEMQMLTAEQNRQKSECGTALNRSQRHAPRQRCLVVATATAHAPALPMVFQAPVDDGSPLELLLQLPPGANEVQLAQVKAGVRRAAAALADLHQSRVRPKRVRSVDAELTKLKRRCHAFLNVNAPDAANFVQLAQQLGAGREKLVAWGEEITIVHGDCKPSQFFLLPQAEVALLDFDHCGLADPAADVGNFLATLRQSGVKQLLKQRHAAAWQRWMALLEEAFLEEYVASRVCHPHFKQRATWYMALALLRKGLRSCSRSTRSPLPSLLVGEARQLLDSQ